MILDEPTTREQTLIKKNYEGNKSRQRDTGNRPDKLM